MCSPTTRAPGSAVSSATARSSVFCRGSSMIMARSRVTGFSKTSPGSIGRRSGGAEDRDATRCNPRRLLLSTRTSARNLNTCARMYLLSLSAQRKVAQREFGIFSVSDVTPNPVTGHTPSEAERINAIVKIAQRADEVGLDVFAIGEHHNPPFFSSAPTTLLAYIAAMTERILLSTAVTLVTTNDPVRIAEEYAMLQHLCKGRMDLIVGRGNTDLVYQWFGQDSRAGVPLALANYDLLHRLWRED